MSKPIFIVVIGLVMLTVDQHREISRDLFAVNGSI